MWTTTPIGNMEHFSIAVERQTGLTRDFWIKRKKWFQANLLLNAERIWYQAGFVVARATNTS